MPKKLSKKALDALECALALLNKPRTWIAGNWAITKDGRTVPPNNPRAVRFCVMGAIDHCFGVDGDWGLPQNLRNELDQTALELYPRVFKSDDADIITLNDKSTNSRRVKRVLRTILQNHDRHVS